MKRIIYLVLILTIMVPFLGGCRCSKKKVTGTEAAKILLANKHLNGEVFDESGTLFTLGEDAFNKVVKETRKYARKNAGRSNEAYVVVEGDTYKWYNDIEYSNFNTFFESYATNIEFSAKQGAELISFVKDNISVVDVWVEYRGDQYLLKVDKTSETIYTRNETGTLEICKRTTDENGNDVYELLNSYDHSTVRMKYIPDLLYEFSIIDNNENGYNHYLIADKSKGYWNIISSTGSHSTVLDDGTVIKSISFETLVMKEEGFYKFSYGLDNQGWSNGNIDTITLISSDGKTDLVTVSNGIVHLFNTGIKGLDHIEITAPKELVGDYNPELNNEFIVYEQDNVDSKGNPYKIYSTSGFKSAVAVLENGISFTENDLFLDDKVRVGRIDVGYVAGCEAYGIIPLRLEAKDLNETFDILVEFLDETNLSFKRDLDTVLKSAEFALNDVENFHEYFQLNGYNIDSIEKAEQALEVEKQKVITLKQSYDEVKDASVIKYRKQDELQKNTNFASLELLNNGTINNSYLEININDFKVKTQDTILFVDGKQYEIVFALLKEDGNLIPLNSSNDSSTTFTAGSAFEIAQSTKVAIPVVDAGTYVLVAYIATVDEGIRVSEPLTVQGNFTGARIFQEGIMLTLASNSEQNLLVKSENNIDIYLNINKALSYDELVYYMGQSAYNHGMVEDKVIEYLDGDTWKTLEKTSELITTGNYRMKYIVTINNIQDLEGYVYLTINE